MLTSTGFTGALTGNAATATKFASSVNINGVAFDGSAAITVAAAGSTLTGSTLASSITGSSLTSVGTLSSLTISGNISMTGTGAIDVAAGTTGQRPGSASAGMFRYNSTEGQFEGYTDSWGAIGGGAGATGGGTDEIFVENGQTIASSYTLTAGKNASSVGDLTLNSGVVVTIPANATWAGL